MLRNKTCRGQCRLLPVRVNFDANKMYISDLSISNGYLQNLEHYWGVCFMLKLYRTLVTNNNRYARSNKVTELFTLKNKNKHT